MKNLQQQLRIFKETIQSGKWSKDSDVYRQSVQFLDSLPTGALSAVEIKECQDLMQRAFGTPHVSADTVDPGPFDPLIPKDGWLREYYTFTLRSEPPTVFHFMTALTVLGAVLERRVYFDKGFYRVYPNIATVLIAPTGKCRKTSAANIALKFAREVNTNVLSDRVTPEALVEALSGRETATGLVYAPELAVFLGRQKYLEGMVPLLTSLFDAPDVWSSNTIGRGEATLTHVALSFLGASTLEWFVEALPSAAFSGGFMSRLLFVVQKTTDREFALPIQGAGHVHEHLREQLEDMQELEGEVLFAKGAKTWYEQWYSKHHKADIQDAKFAGYHERKPDHMLRVAFLLGIARGSSLMMGIEDLEHALKILDWLEAWLPDVFQTVSATPQGANLQRILSHLEKLEGYATHSQLLRKVQHQMNARTFYESVQTLVESGTVAEVNTPQEHSYKILEVKWTG